MVYEICDVEFVNKEEYHIVNRCIESSKIEGFVPTNESVSEIVDLLDGKLTIRELVKKHQNKPKIEIEL